MASTPKFYERMLMKNYRRYFSLFYKRYFAIEIGCSRGYRAFSSLTTTPPHPMSWISANCRNYRLPQAKIRDLHDPNRQLEPAQM